MVLYWWEPMPQPLSRATPLIVTTTFESGDFHYYHFVGGEQKFREVKRYAQGHTAWKCQSKDM